uniref:RNase H type-1 domain-containing protein n=1 Tax=Oryza glaberrima TaxID=4538 RepID=I1PKD5_ORYGL
MKRYPEAVRSMEKCFIGITVEHLPRGQNEEADTLAKSAACGGPNSLGIFFEILHAPSVPMGSLEVMAIDQVKLGEDPYDWRTPFLKHLETGWLPEDEAEAKRLQLRATKPTKFSPFMLLYGDEAMNLAELGANSSRVMFSGGEEGREVSLELLEGVRVEALEHMHKYATSTSATYNKKVRPMELMPGHLVLRKKANPIAVGKLESKWEGPYLIKHKSRTGSFRLATLEGDEFDHSWNAASLKRFYV